MDELYINFTFTSLDEINVLKYEDDETYKKITKKYKKIFIYVEYFNYNKKIIYDLIHNLIVNNKVNSCKDIQIITNVENTILNYYPI